MTIEHRQNPKLLWGIVAGLILAIATFFAIAQWILIKNESQNAYDSDIIMPTSTTIPATAFDETAASQATPTAPLATTQVLIEESVLNQPIAENATLAAEELAKLNELQAQLQEQQTTLAAQHTDADELLKLKEEQIKLLEAQLAAQ